jgi:hypothetical protein
MSTAARKARKRAGIKFYKAPKVGTPPELRQASVFAQWAVLDAMLRRGEISRKEWRRAGWQVDRGFAAASAVKAGPVRRGVRRMGGK